MTDDNEDHTLARNSDPETSHEAADDKKKLWQRALRFYATYDRDIGLTDYEIEEAIDPGYLGKSPWHRSGIDLTRRGLVEVLYEDGEKLKRWGGAGKLQQVKRITDKGWKYLAELEGKGE